MGGGFEDVLVGQDFGEISLGNVVDYIIRKRYLKRLNGRISSAVLNQQFCMYVRNGVWEKIRFEFWVAHGESFGEQSQ